MAASVTGHQRGHKRGVPIYFDPDQVEAVREWATNKEVSFSEAVRTLVEWGLEADKIEG